MKTLKIMSVLVSSSLLFACNSKQTSSDSNKGEVITTFFDTLKSGVKVETNVTEIIDGVSRNYLIETAMKEKEVSFIQYSDLNKENKMIHECYLGKKGDNYVYGTRLNVANSISYYQMYNPVASEYYTWKNGYTNPFSLIQFEDFEYVDKNYSLKWDKMNVVNINQSLCTLLYGNPGLTIAEFKVSKKDDGKFHISAFADPYKGSKTYEYEFESIITQMGDETSIDYLAVPFDSVEDALFDKMITDLKTHNYIASATNYRNDTLVSQSFFRSNEDKLSYDINVDGEEIHIGYYVDENGKLQEVTKINEQYQKTGNPSTQKINRYRPAFNLSRACFEKVNETTYKMKDRIEGSVSAYYSLETETVDLNQFSIEITNDGYVFTNISGARKTIVTFTNIGDANVGFDPSLL